MLRNSKWNIHLLYINTLVPSVLALFFCALQRDGYYSKPGPAVKQKKLPQDFLQGLDPCRYYSATKNCQRLNLWQSDCELPDQSLIQRTDSALARSPHTMLALILRSCNPQASSQLTSLSQ